MRFLRYFSGMKRKIERHHRIFDRITDSIIDERKQGNATKGGDDDEHDLLDVLLKFQGDHSLEIPLTTENIKSVLLDGAGVESSTQTVEWALAEMLRENSNLRPVTIPDSTKNPLSNHFLILSWSPMNSLKREFMYTLPLFFF
ncbi:hypothetical protein ACS0TY_004925 [Phlomoides rotata]